MVDFGFNDIFTSWCFNDKLKISNNYKQILPPKIFLWRGCDNLLLFSFLTPHVSLCVMPDPTGSPDAPHSGITQIYLFVSRQPVSLLAISLWRPVSSHVCSILITFHCNHCPDGFLIWGQSLKLHESHCIFVHWHWSEICIFSDFLESLVETQVPRQINNRCSNVFFDSCSIISIVCHPFSPPPPECFSCVTVWPVFSKQNVM